MLESTTSPVEELKRKIATRQAVVGVVGLGYVGLPFAVEKAKVGFKVIGVEQNPRRAGRISNKEKRQDVNLDLFPRMWEVYA
ncbi:hypothetical protein QT17_09300 [Thermus sp. 2.9]|uniref:hypothetical protein n=1 Tax=Thermus sp. (strain 2.9) TaxID=1577051 RepID=UPI00054312FD|nr:hypothetical protein [Thermus sp. 2.9]KHG65060.1 hypothetical protein QT17_09300 [Thermus sp. 2.9]